MSFSSDAKAELCRAKVDKKCCAIAESYGVLLYCNTFTPREIRIITASDAFAARLPRLFRRAFSVAFDVLPDESAAGKRSFIIRDRDKIEKIFETFGAEAGATLTHHVNFGVIEEDCDRVSFLRGAFLAGGSVTDPEKRYHLELATPHHAVSRESYSVLLELGFTARRQINCDSANADKVVSAAQEQLDAIRRIAKQIGLDELSEPLRDAALLRITNPAASLADLAQLSYPKVTKSCLSHRLRKLTEMAQALGEE